VTKLPFTIESLPLDTQEIVSEDDFAIFHELLTDGTADQTDEVTLQPTTSVKHDRIRKMIDVCSCIFCKTMKNLLV
jgi:hypothetical protein